MRSPVAFCVLSIVATGGCSRTPAPTNEVDIAAAADRASGSVNNYAALPDDRPRPAPTPAAQPADDATTEPSDKSEATASDAVAVLKRYFALIDQGQQAQAWDLWDQDGQASGMSREAFADSFGKFADYRAEIGTPGRVDAGAGQRYITIPVRVSGRLKDGDRPFAMEGPVTLHRAGDIDGAAPEQRSWRISDSGLKPRPAQASKPDLPDRTTARYRCEDGTGFTAMFDNRADTATLRLDGGQSVTLDGQRPASGIWYRNPRYELRGKGREATFTRGRAMPVNCVATP